MSRRRDTVRGPVRLLFFFPFVYLYFFFATLLFHPLDRYQRVSLLFIYSVRLYSLKHGLFTLRQSVVFICGLSVHTNEQLHLAGHSVLPRTL